MVLDVVVLQMLLTNHDRHLSNVWDCVMKQPMKTTSMKDRSFSLSLTIGTSDGCSKPRLSKLIEQIASQNCGT